MVVLFLAQNIEITKFFFIKTALLKSKIITIFVKLLHKSFVSWNKKKFVGVHLNRIRGNLREDMSKGLSSYKHRIKVTKLYRRPRTIARRLSLEQDDKPRNDKSKGQTGKRTLEFRQMYVGCKAMLRVSFHTNYRAIRTDVLPYTTSPRLVS